MSRRLLLLGGLAILAVVCNHAASWGFTAMFAWTDSYRPVTVPDFAQLGSPTYYVLLTIKQLAVFSVPSFLFISGFFVAYAARGSQSGLRWKAVLVRVRNLLIPYLIWSCAIFVGDALQGTVYSPAVYLEKLLLGKATGAYFYVPLLCQFYLLSPLLIPFAKTAAKQVLLISALLQLLVLGSRYLAAYGAATPIVTFVVRLAPLWFFPGWAFFFALGAVSGLHVASFGRFLRRFKWVLLIATVGLAVAAMLEPQAAFHPQGVAWDRFLYSLSSQLYAVASILCFLAFQEVAIPGPRILSELGRASYGIYLLHPPLLNLAARGTRQVAPWILGHQILFQPLLIVFSIGVPLLLMRAVSKSPARKSYRFLFG
jgi:membrane-bound acyltransferase YfiQ involved in biofilm formation